MRPPDRPLLLPTAVLDRHPGWRAELAWSNVPEAATWRLTNDEETPFVKTAIAGHHGGFAPDLARLAWAAGRVPVPAVLDHGANDGVEWLLLAGLPGRDATVHDLRHDPAELVPILARALRALHETPAEDCPFDFRLDVALDLVRRRVAEGLVVPETDFHAEHRHLTARETLDRLESRRPEHEDVVLCHGDYCPPNVLLDERGAVTGYVDLGELGLADRWWDLAVATWSVTWNFGSGWEDLFLDAYGAAPDPERSAFYRLLYDVVS